MAEDNLYAPPQADIEVDDDVELAGRGARLGGAILDSIIAMLFLVPVIFLTGYWDRAMAGEDSTADSVMITVIAIVVFALLNGFLLATRGQTIGKLLVKTRIVSNDNGKILSLVKIFSLRYLPVWVISAIPGVGQIFGLVNSLFIFRNDRRCLHDLIAGTKVVTAKALN